MMTGKSATQAKTATQATGTKGPETDAAKEKREPVARIVARRNGFRRAGIVHSTTPTVYYEGDLTKEQIAVLKGEPMLVVDLRPDVAEETKSEGPAEA